MQSVRNSSTVSTGSRAGRARVIVADPFPIILIGLRKMMENEPRLQIVAEVSTMPALWEKVLTEGPEVALVDWSLAAQDLAATTLLLRSALHRTSMIFLTTTDDAHEKQAMIRLGASGVISKRSSAAELQKGILQATCNRGTADKNPGFDIEPSARIPASNWTEPELRIRQLTRRERQLIPLVCQGMRNKAIAEQLGISESTVWHHLTSVFTKLQVEDRMGLAALAYHHRLVLPATPAVALRAD